MKINKFMILGATAAIGLFPTLSNAMGMIFHHVEATPEDIASVKTVGILLGSVIVASLIGMGVTLAHIFKEAQHPEINETPSVSIGEKIKKMRNKLFRHNNESKLTN